MSNLQYWGIFQSPHENNGEPYIGQPENSINALHSKEEDLITYFTTAEEAEDFLKTL